MFLKLKQVVAGSLVALMAILVSPTPARADVIFGCSDSSLGGLGTICLFDGTYYGKYHWHQMDMSYIINEDDGGISGCAQFPATFINVASSMVINPGVNGNSLWGQRVRFYPNNFCTGTPSPWWWADQENVDDDLTTSTWGNVSNTWNSVRIGG